MIYGQNTRLHRPHRLDGIHNQIQNDLLQLDLIAKYRRNAIVNRRLSRSRVSVKSMWTKFNTVQIKLLILT